MAIVLVPLAEGFEDMEAITITDLLRRAQIEVVTAGLKPGPVKGSRGTSVIPNRSLDEALKQSYDMIVLPGGQPGATNLGKDDRIQELVQSMAKNNKFTAAICAAPKVLANAGVLAGKRVTSFPGTLTTDEFPKLEVTELPVVRDGKVITSRGPGTAIDFSLLLIEILSGKDVRRQVEDSLHRSK